MPVGGKGAETGGGARGKEGKGSGGRLKDDNLAELLDAKLDTGLGQGRDNEGIDCPLLTTELAELYGEI